MRKTLAYFLFIPLLGLTALVAQDKTPPAKLVLPARNGDVAFDHAAHAKRENNNCVACHPALFAQDAKKPVAFRPPHKTEENNKTSCGFCHRAGGTAFATAGNCSNGKCHVRAGAAKE
jgi:c(7)-type cytochrome triheme protein